jgi:hypothetical protein
VVFKIVLIRLGSSLVEIDGMNNLEKDGKLSLVGRVRQGDALDVISWKSRGGGAGGGGGI